MNSHKKNNISKLLNRLELLEQKKQALKKNKDVNAYSLYLVRIKQANIILGKEENDGIIY